MNTLNSKLLNLQLDIKNLHDVCKRQGKTLQENQLCVEEAMTNKSHVRHRAVLPAPAPLITVTPSDGTRDRPTVGRTPTQREIILSLRFFQHYQDSGYCLSSYLDLAGPENTRSQEYKDGS